MQLTPCVGQGRCPRPSRVENFGLGALQDSCSARSSAACRSSGSGEVTLDVLARDGVLEGQPRRVQELALEAEQPARAVLRIAAHRMADGAQMHADLVRAPGLEAQAQQRAARKRPLEREMGSGLARARATDRHARAHARVTADRRLDRPERAGGRPSTSATYSRSISRLARSSCRRRSASSLRATIRSPEVSRSSRCTIQRAPVSPPAASGASICASVFSRCPRAGCTTTPGALSRTIT